MNIGWFTTAPHPWKRAHTHGADDGQIGWRLHAVPVDDKGDPLQSKANAMCGLRPRHGWGNDLFIDAECTRCDAAMTKREAAGEVFIDLHEKLAEQRKAAELAASEPEPDYVWKRRATIEQE